METTSGYARPELLVEPDWLAQHLEDPTVRIIDCASLEAYRRAHIPGAVGLPVDTYIKDANDPIHVMPPDQFAELMAKMGVTDDMLIVTYDDNNALLASRLWWVLNYYGHTNTRVLNGGWHRWLTEGRLVTFHQSRPQRGNFTPRTNESIICLVDDLKAKVDSGGSRVLDMRSDGEWLGTNSRGNKRVGHVPNAAHIEWLNFVTHDDHRVFRPANEIQQLLDAEGVTRDEEVVTYCQGGIRAAHGAFVLTLMGYDKVRNYDGSMGEWANRDDTQLVMEPSSES